MGGAFWSCTTCGGTWFRIRREVRLPAQGVTSMPTAPGAQPVVVETRFILTCVDCGEDV